MSVRRLRCAIYTRKSTEEGLDQEFNSLDAQREACEAFIKSQRHEGWVALAGAYDDGGRSGGTMNRPALRRLLDDIAEGRVDAIVVYKVDRLTRALSDFARMVDIFDQHDVSFVSVTQQFNTTTSMGRLTLNVLLAFAQFEREVTGERIRDKIAASMKKGMWMGGLVPLGYDAIDKKLVVNIEEAETVRALFQLYLEHANVRLVKQEADRRGLKTKSRSPNNGRRPGGAPFTRGHIYKLLSNPIYVGEVVHKGKRYPGLHEAIIDDDTWDAVQDQLRRNAIDRRSGSNAKTPSLLAGLLRDEDGRRMSPSHARKGDRRYRYYVSKGVSHGDSDWSLPAMEIERVVLDGIDSFLRAKLELIKGLNLPKASPGRLKALLGKAETLADQIARAGPAEQRGILLDILDHIDARQDRVRIVFRTHALLSMMEDGTQDPGHRNKGDESETTFALDLEVQFKRRGAGMKLVIQDDRARRATPDPELIDTVAKGRRWFAEIRDGTARSVTELAASHDVDRTDVGRGISLAFLAPDIVEAIIAGRQPIELTAARLRRVRDLPVSWVEQSQILRFAR
jgi:DNA invertase Pin-like site-specific DNA recombinase